MDLRSAGLLPPLPSSFLEGSDLDLLAPLRFLRPGDLPTGDPPRVDRGPLAAALAVANEGYGHPAAARLAERLADPSTRVVVTGQQPGLLGGPLYTLTKAIAAADLAQRLEGSGHPAVAVFWVATEDHDFAESSRTAVLAPGGPRRFDLGDDPAPLLPVGMRSFGPRVADLLEELTETMPGERYAGWLATLGRWYRPETRFGEAFCRLMVGLLGASCPLLLDSMLPALKEAEAPLMERLVRERSRVDELYAAADERIAGRGYDLQVQPRPGASPLFLFHGRERRRIRWCPEDRFSLRGADDCQYEVQELLDVIAENPAIVSPGVLARPAFQDAALGTFVQVLGPGELSYMPQVAPIYDLLEVAAPWTALRPQAVVLEDHQIEKMDELGLPLERLVAPDFDLDAWLAERTGVDLVGPVRGRLETLLDELEAPALALDPNLEKPLEKTRDSILRALDTFAGKVSNSLARRNEVARGRANVLRDTVRPAGILQERVVSSVHFTGKYGPRFVAELEGQLGWRSDRLQVIRIGAERSSE